MEREERKFSKDFFFFPSTQNFPPTLLRQSRRRREENTLSPLAQMPGSPPFMTRKFALFLGLPQTQKLCLFFFPESRAIPRNHAIQPSLRFPFYLRKEFSVHFFFRHINMGKKGGQHEMQAKGFSFSPRHETIFFSKAPVISKNKLASLQFLGNVSFGPPSNNNPTFP